MYFTVYKHIIFFNADINECIEGRDNCSQMCTNTEGSFTCGCVDGYLLDIDETTCNGMYLEFIQYSLLWSLSHKIVLAFYNPHNMYLYKVVFHSFNILHLASWLSAMAGQLPSLSAAFILELKFDNF